MYKYSNIYEKSSDHVFCHTRPLYLQFALAVGWKWPVLLTYVSSFYRYRIYLVFLMLNLWLSDLNDQIIRLAKLRITFWHCENSWLNQNIFNFLKSTFHTSFQLDSNQQIAQFGIYQSVRNLNITKIVPLNATNAILQIFIGKLSIFSPISFLGIIDEKLQLVV